MVHLFCSLFNLTYYKSDIDHLTGTHPKRPAKEMGSTDPIFAVKPQNMIADTVSIFVAKTASVIGGFMSPGSTSIS